MDQDKVKKFLLILLCTILTGPAVFLSCSPAGPDVPPDPHSPEETETRLDWSGLSYMLSTMDELLELEAEQPTSGYSVEAFSALKKARAAVADAIEKARSGKISQEDIDSAVASARSALDTFRNSYKHISSPCELYVPGALDATCGILLGKSGEFDDLITLTAELWFKGDEVLHYQQQGIIIGNFKGQQPFDGWALNSWSLTQAPNDTHPRTAPYMIRSSRCYDAGTLREPATNWTSYQGWHHLALTYDASNGYVAIYIDGTPVVEDTYDHPYRKPVVPTQTCLLCNPATTGDRYHTMGMSGSVKNVRLWEKALSREDLLKYKDSDVNGDEEGLVAAWDFTTTPENPSAILDKTGRHYAKVEGGVKWMIKN